MHPIGPRPYLQLLSTAPSASLGFATKLTAAHALLTAAATDDDFGEPAVRRLFSDKAGAQMASRLHLEIAEGAKAAPSSRDDVFLAHALAAAARKFIEDTGNPTFQLSFDLALLGARQRGLLLAQDATPAAAMAPVSAAVATPRTTTRSLAAQALAQFSATGRPRGTVTVSAPSEAALLQRIAELNAHSGCGIRIDTRDMIISQDVAFGTGVKAFVPFALDLSQLPSSYHDIYQQKRDELVDALVADANKSLQYSNGFKSIRLQRQGDNVEAACITDYLRAVVGPALKQRGLLLGPNVIITNESAVQFEWQRPGHRP